jgi:hypothetical protein
MKINEEYKELLYPLKPEEYQSLEMSILKEGCLIPIVLWNDTIVDGHNRYEICQKHNIEFKTIQKEFKDDLEAKLWILNNQLGRRNLTPYTYSCIVIKAEDLFKNKGKLKQSEAGKLHQKSEKAPFNSLKEMSKIARVSPDTMFKVIKIQEKGSDELKKQLSANEISINKAYKEIEKKPDKKVDTYFTEEQQMEIKIRDYIIKSKLSHKQLIILMSKIKIFIEEVKKV